MNGLLLVDKPAGFTSHDVVARVRRLAEEPSVGHLGTLDPMATGLLPLLLGKWTRLARYYGSLAKTYTGVVRFGFATDTYDAEGAPATPPMRPALRVEEVRALAAAFGGETEQMPPPYSAKKLNGKPAYALARAGVVPELKSVRVTVDLFEIERLRTNPDGTVDAPFRMRISSGGYVRSVAHAMGQRAGCGAHLAALRRTDAGPLTLDSAWTVEKIEACCRAGELRTLLPHPRAVLTELPAVTADGGTVERIRHGGVVALPQFSAAPTVRVFAGQRELVAIADRVAGVLFQPKVVLG